MQFVGFPMRWLINALCESIDEEEYVADMRIHCMSTSLQEVVLRKEKEIILGCTFKDCGILFQMQRSCSDS